MQPIPALPDPYDANRPRLRRQVLSFNEALHNLKTARSGSVQCAAFRTCGRCPKDIDLNDLDLHPLLEKLSTTDKDSIINILRLMLCPTHWRQTVFYSALFLDFISDLELRQNTEDFENIVVDLESARVINEEEHSIGESFFVSEDMTAGQGKQASTINSSNEVDFYASFNRTPASQTDSENLSSVTSTTMSTQTTISETNSSEETNKKIKGSFSDTNFKDEQAQKTLEVTSVVSLHSYASLELGVARLEIMYQKNLKCISMAPNGWRCQVLIQSERLLEARRLLSSLSGLENELKDLSKLVLCPGHSVGDLPQLYSEAWSAFAANRLTKREAMLKFEAGNWRSVPFFGNNNSPLTDPGKTKFDFNFVGTQSKTPSKENTDLDSESSVSNTRMSQQRPLAFTSEATIPAIPIPVQRQNLVESLEAISSSTLGVPLTPASTFVNSQGLTPVVNRVITPSPLGDPSDRDTDFVTKSDCSESRVDQILPLSSGKRMKIPFPSPDSPKRSITVELPPDPLNIFNETSNPPSDYSQAGALNEASSPNYTSSVTAGDLEDGAVSEDKGGSPIPQALQSSTPQNFQRDFKQPIQIISQGVIHNSIIKEILSSIPRGGFVYVLKSADRKLVKVGKATNVARRIQEIKAGYQLDDLVEVESDSYIVDEPEKVEKLVHLELRNFRVNVICQHLRGNNSEEVSQEHREWFDVPEEVAVQSVQRWREFVQMAYTPQGTIKESWARKTSLLPISSTE